MVYVHGGAWAFGDKLVTGSKVPFFTSRGWVLVSVNYRLLPDADPLVQVQDVARAIAWVHSRIDRYGGDRNELYLMGHSAGGHLVSLVATDLRRLRQAGKEFSILRGVIELDTAALDVVKLMEKYADFYTRFFGDDRRRWEEASPIAHVAAGKPIPPFLLAVAAGSEAKLAQARHFATALQRAGVRAEILEAPDKTHTSLNRDLGAKGDRATAAIMEFIDSIRQNPAEQASRRS
jgi:acetyl esterase/lipase